jgi:hypothetical protein
MINYDALNEKQRQHFENAVNSLSAFRSHADAIMYYCGNTPSDEDLDKFREAYDLVCKAIDLIN